MVNKKRFSNLSRRIDRFSEKVIFLEKNIGDIQTDFSDLHSVNLNLRTTIKIHEDRLKHLEESDDSNTMDRQLNCPPGYNTNVNVHGMATLFMEILIFTYMWMLMKIDRIPGDWAHYFIGRYKELE